MGEGGKKRKGEQFPVCRRVKALPKCEGGVLSR